MNTTPTSLYGTHRIMRMAMLLRRFVFTAFAAGLLASLAVTAWFSQERDLNNLTRQITLVVFTDANATAKEIADVGVELQTIAGIDSVERRPADTLREEFVARFATSVSSILNTNPFPTAYILRLQEKARTKDHIDTIAAEIRSLKGVSDISYRAAFLHLVEKRLAEAGVIRWLSGGVVLLVLVTMLWNAASSLELPKTGLQPAALGLLAGSLLSFVLAIVLYYLFRASLPSLDGMRPISLLSGAAIVCALGGIALVLRALLLVKAAPAQSEEHAE